MNILDAWSTKERNDYKHTAMIVRQRLNETGLFTDDALAALLDRHPNHLIDFQHISDNPEIAGRHTTVDFSGADGKTMLEAANSSGKIWINIRQAMNLDPAYKQVFDQFHAELEMNSGKNKDRRNCNGGILISSAAASTPYHSDPMMTHLCHIRGHKKMWVYPTTEEFLPDDSYESIILGETDEDVPYYTRMDKGAVLGPVDLTGGEFVTWPHRAPHRVENVTYCVSMAMEFTTLQTAFVNAGAFANGVMRRKFGMNASWRDASTAEKSFKAAAGFAMRKMGVSKPFQRTDLVRFKLDSTARGFVRPVTNPYQRVH